MTTQMTIQDALSEKENVFTDLLFAIKDLKAGTFTPPFVATTEGEGQRMFTTMVCYGGDNLIAKYPSDYELYKIGRYNRRTGICDCSANVDFIISAESVRNLETIRLANDNKKNTDLLKDLSE